jgi:hypothetical protein
VRGEKSSKFRVPSAEFEEKKAAENELGTGNWGLGTDFAAKGGAIALFFFVWVCSLRSSLAHLFDEKVNICLFLSHE